MHRFCIPALLVLCLSGCGGCRTESQTEEISAEGKEMIPVDPPEFDAENDWPWWRGPNRDGKSGGDHEYPLRWDSEENVVWKVDIPGRGLGSPIVVGDRVFLPTAEKSNELQTVLCFDRNDGSQRWRKDVHQGGLGSKGHSHSTYASSTLACDGERVFAAFRNDGNIVVTALDLEGKQLWQTTAGPHKSQHGFSVSPVVYKQLVIISADSNGKGFIAALHRKTGEIWWRKKRNVGDSYATPVVAHVAGKDQLLLSGGRKVHSYDPMTGNENWSVEGTADSTCSTMVWNDETVFASGGHPQSQTIAVNADGSTEVRWSSKKSFYVASMLLVDSRLFGFDYKNSTALMFDADTGNVAKQIRLARGFYGSPVLAGGHIYVPARNGRVFVLDPKTGRKVADNQLGDEMDTTVTPAGGQLFLRVASNENGRQETLYCIGKK